MSTRTLVLLISAAGCAGAVAGPRPDAQNNFHESASAALVGSSAGRAVLAVADIENVGGSEQALSWGVDCGGSGALTLNVYRVNGDTKTLVWTSAAVPRLLGCPTRLV